jgi:hypothetical protein
MLCISASSAAAGDRHELRRGGLRIVPRVVGGVTVVLAAGDQDHDRIAAGAVCRGICAHRRNRGGFRVHEGEVNRAVLVADITQTGRNDAGIVADATVGDGDDGRAGICRRGHHHSAGGRRRLRIAWLPHCHTRRIDAELADATGIARRRIGVERHHDIVHPGRLVAVG